ncbi:MAG: acyltransferase [Actinomycetota bacterium]|nr:acyltransferase [Actinomycetota bacterium]
MTAVTPRRGESTRPGRLVTSTEFGVVHWLSGYVRRRAGLVLARLRFRRVDFGSRCDVRAGARLLVARSGAVRFGAGCVLDRGFDLECRGRVTVGPGTIFGHHCTVAAHEAVEIGRDCLLAELVSIRDHDHAFAATETAIVHQGREVAPVRIGDNVWLGAKVTVVKGVSIGDNVVVGAHAVVTRDIPPDSIAVGVPARVVGHRGGTAAPT